MPLSLPSLDNRTFDELVAEGRALLPRHAPGWTDHNFHDPGVTLLELFAWLVEQDIYRLDRVSPASYRAFLRLIGIEPRPAQVAETVVVFSSDMPAELPAGAQVGDVTGATIFQTTGPSHISPAQLTAVFTGLNQSRIDRMAENQTVGRLYQPFEPRPQPGDALYLGFDQPLAGESVEVCLYVWTGTAAMDGETRRALIAEWEAAQVEAEATCPPGMALALPGWWLHYSAHTIWEYYSPGATWLPLDGVADESRGLTLSGPVRFMAPTDHAPGGPDGDHFYIRCRLVGGQYDCPPEIDGVALNAVSVSHAADVKPEQLLGHSNGRAGQRFQLGDTPVVPGSSRLKLVLNGMEDEAWREVSFWDLVGPHDRAYLLIPETGQIVFGDGRVGRVPAAGAEIRAVYRIGGGPGGNVAAGSLIVSLNGSYNVAQPYAASGGAAAETLAQAQGRALDALAERRGAITLDDYAALARATPGAPVARARALAEYHPAVPCFPAPGCVTVVVVPRCTETNPTPGPDLLRAVAHYLERRRPLTAEVHVIGPCYTPVVVHARLHVRSRADTGQLAALAQTALDRFFHPLYGGAEGDGWPVGRDVFRAEVLALLNGLPGVAYVNDLGLQTEGDPEPRCGNIPLCPDCLVASGRHRIAIDEGATTIVRAKPAVDCE